jgi:hypothetical protein
MTDAPTPDLTAPEQVKWHLDIACNHESGLIPTATRQLVEALSAKLEAAEDERNKWEAATHQSQQVYFAVVAERDAALGVLAKADDAMSVLENPVRSDDGFYDYFQHDIDPAIAAFLAARTKGGE